MTAEPLVAAEHEAWIRAHVDVDGPITQPRVFPWSTVLRVPTQTGVVWFKENVPVLAHEAAVVELLVARAPDDVPEPVSVDADRGWLLTRDAGTRLRDVPPTAADWLTLLPLYADLQLAVAPDADRLVAAGAPDRRPAVLPALFRELAEHEAERLGAEELRQLRAFAHRVDDACAALGQIGVPCSIQHDDFHDGNIFVRDGRFRFIDWGDACVSHPFATLRIPLEGIAEDTDWDVDAIRDSYLEVFSDRATRVELLQAFEDAWVVAGVTRALKWAPLVASLPRPHEWEDAVAIRLRVLLEEPAG